MITANEPSTEVTITLTAEEREQLLNWLQQRLRKKLVEEHRTEAAAFRETVVHEELIDKLIANSGRH